MSKKQAFICHIREDAPVAARLKAALDRDFLGNLDVYLLSDEAGPAAVEEWLQTVDTALRSSALCLTLYRPAAVRRAWINFEAGAAWGLEVPIIPICHEGLRPDELPLPLSLRQGLSLDDPEGLSWLYSRIAEVLSCRVPARSFADLSKELTNPAPAGAIDGGPSLLQLADAVTRPGNGKARGDGGERSAIS